jgi:hypothetical protein
MNSKKTLVLSIVTLIVMIIFAGGVTYAYFTNQARTTTQDVDVKTHTSNSLYFNITNNLTLDINQDDFAIDVGNKEASSTGVVKLKANTENNTASLNYNVSLKIDTNDFKYTTSSKQAELILQVTSPDGEIKSIDGLTYTSVTNGLNETISGFDITEATTGTYNLATNYNISTTSTEEVTQNWSFKVIFVNLGTDQGEESATGNSNLEKTFKGAITMQKTIQNE